MKFGMGPLGCRRPDGTTEGMVPVYEQSIRLAETAEEVGFDSAWVAEHHFVEDGYLPSPAAMAAAIAARTGGLQVGIGLQVVPVHEPLEVAENAAVLNILARNGGGRFTLGLGLGYRDIEYEAFGADRSERVGKLLDTVETCRGAWSDDPLNIDGRTVAYPEVNVTPKPGPGIELIIGANAAPGIKRAARVGDGYVAAPGLSPDDLDKKLENAREILDEDERSEFDIYHMQYASIHRDGKDAAYEAVRDGYIHTRKKYLQFFNESGDSDLDMSDEDLEASVDRFEDRWRADLLHGSPAEVVEELRGYEDCWEGDIHTILQLHYPGQSFDVSSAAVELAGDAVIPELRDV